VSERLPEAIEREEFPLAVRRAAWARCGGRCEGCGKPLDIRIENGGRVKFTYDHTVPFRRSRDSSLANCKVICADGPDSCDAIKTYREDLPGIAAIKRYGKNRLPLDIDRPVKRAPKIKTRKANWPQGRKIPNRPFPAKRSP
jgi:hypothetical protein